MLLSTAATSVEVVFGCIVRVSLLPDTDWLCPMVRIAIRARGSPLPPVSATTSASRSWSLVETVGVPPVPFCSVTPMLCALPPVSVNDVTNRLVSASTQLRVASVCPPRVYVPRTSACWMSCTTWYDAPARPPADTTIRPSGLMAWLVEDQKSFLPT